MRILVVSQYFWPENFRINDLVCELTKRGHQVTVLTGYPNYPGGKLFDEFRKDPAKFSEYCGAKVVRAPLVVRGEGNGLRLIANYLSFAVSASIVGSWQLRRTPFDVVFAFEPSPITVGLPAALLSHLKKAPMAMWVLDLWPDTLAAIGVLKSRLLLEAIGSLVAFIYRRCDLVLVQSKAFIPAVWKYSRGARAREKVTYFPTWAELLFSGAAAEPACEIPWNPDVFTVVFAGNIGDAQDFPAILAAAERLKGDGRIRWVIVGDGRALGWVQSEVERRGLSKNVLLVGRYPLERMPSFYRHADALLVSLRADPAFQLTVPGKVQSYLQAGIPIVAMLDGEGARIIEEAGAGLICAAGSSEGLATAVAQMASLEPAARHAMGQRGVTYATREFDRGTLIRRLESLFDSMLERKNASASVLFDADGRHETDTKRRN